LFSYSTKEAEKLLTFQWGSLHEIPISNSSEEMEKWLADLSEQLSHFPSRDEHLSQMAEVQKHVGK
jgi:hypothetical protein